MLKPMMAIVALAGLTGPCELASALKDGVVVGTWGGENAGLIADDTSGHVHIACTYGNVHQGIEPDAQGHFDVAGEYVLRAYPVAVGPSLPARFQGTVRGDLLQLTVTVTDTTGDTTAHLGPVTLVFGREPKMGPCPICSNPRGRP